MSFVHSFQCFPVKSPAIALAVLMTVGHAHAAGLDRSGQSSADFFRDGTFASVGYVSINPDISGKDTDGDTISQVATDYSFYTFGAMAEVSDSISLGIFYDQPYGADVTFGGNNNFVGGADASADALIAAQNINLGGIDINSRAVANQVAPNVRQQIAQGQALIDSGSVTGAQAQAIAEQIAQGRQFLGLVDAANIISSDNLENQATNAEVFSDSFTTVVSLGLGDNNNFKIYGGPVLQKLEGNLGLRGDAFATGSGYDATFFKDTSYGWMAGVAYLKPEIALKAALTYRSEIDHELKSAETIPALGLSQTRTMELTTPQSVNLDFQTGLNKTTLLSANARWVPWSKFEIRPPTLFAATGSPLLSYDEDAYLVNVSLGKRLNPNLAVSGSVGWDSGAGNPTSALGPVEGYYSLGLGAKYNLTKEVSISGGARYLMFGDAKGKRSSGEIIGDFDDNSAMVYGLKLEYTQK